MSTAEMISFAAFGTALVVWMMKLTWLIAQMETKTATMWAFQMRRGIVESVEKGIATINSPLAFTDEARNILDPMRNELQAWWKQTGCTMNDAMAALEIERLFGKRLLENVCIPAKLAHAACIILALSVAKNGPISIDSMTAPSP